MIAPSSPPDIRRPLRSSRLLYGLGMAVVMALIFVADTVTDYALAAAGFYTAVILVAVGTMPARALVRLAGFCIFLTVLSFALTRFGSYQVGLINSAISIVAIVITTHLAIRMEAAKLQAQQMQAHLLRMARVTSLGELSASIAHEINQPLAAIATSASAAQRWLGQDPPHVDKAVQTVARIASDAERAGAVIARIRSLTAGAQARKSPLDLAPAILEVVAMTHSDLERHGIALELQLDQDLPAVMADRVQIQQVIMNMVINAMEAMAGTVGGPRRLRIQLHLEPGQGVRCAISDTGPGFQESDPDKLFDAFWTTKDNGMGLGLSISRTIIESNQGQIGAQAHAGAGATFYFSLPVAGMSPA